MAVSPVGALDRLQSTLADIKFVSLLELIFSHLGTGSRGERFSMENSAKEIVVVPMHHMLCLVRVHDARGTSLDSDTLGRRKFWLPTLRLIAHRAFDEGPRP